MGEPSGKAKGGIARAAKLSAERRRNIARRAAMVRWTRAAPNKDDVFFKLKEIGLGKLSSPKNLQSGLGNGRGWLPTDGMTRQKNEAGPMPCLKFDPIVSDFFPIQSGAIDRAVGCFLPTDLDASSAQLYNVPSCAGRSYRNRPVIMHRTMSAAGRERQRSWCGA